MNRDVISVELTPEEKAEALKKLVEELQMAGRTDLLLHAIGAPLLEELRIEAGGGDTACA